MIRLLSNYFLIFLYVKLFLKSQPHHFNQNNYLLWWLCSMCDH